LSKKRKRRQEETKGQEEKKPTGPEVCLPEYFESFTVTPDRAGMTFIIQAVTVLTGVRTRS
jgi:hypothetical protein